MRKINIIIVSFLLAITMTLPMTACSNPAVEPTPTPTTSPSAQTNRTIDKAGQYEIDATTKTLEITAGGVVVKGGNLSKITVTESVGEGEVNFKNVKAETLLVKGGGQNSIYFEDSSAFETVIVEKKDTPIRLVNEIGSSVKTIEISTGSSYVIIEGAVNVLNVLTESVKIETKNASFESVKIDAPNVVIENLKNTNITTTEKATNASVNDKKVEADSSAKIYDSGAVIPPIDFQEPTTPTKPTVSVWKGEVDTAWFDATKTDFTIKNANQFAGIAKLVNDGITTFAGKTITLDIDIDLNSKEWTPIGTANLSSIVQKALSGTFDGNNHKIKNLYITKYASSVSLFGGTIGATIKNVSLLDVNIKTTTSKSIAGVVGVANGALTVDNCKVSGEITGQDTVAGIVSRVYSCTEAKITNCENSATVTATNGKSAGILGMNGIFENTISVEISNCKNTGEIISKNTAPAGTAGIVSYLNLQKGKFTIENCSNSGTVTATGSNCAGIVGTTTGGNALGDVVIKNCINEGSINGVGLVGGIVGSGQGNSVLKIEDCKNNGAISGSSDVAGVAGAMLGNIINFENTGNISGATKVAFGVGTFQTSTTSPLEINNFKNLGGELSQTSESKWGSYLIANLSSASQLTLSNIEVPKGFSMVGMSTKDTKLTFGENIVNSGTINFLSPDMTFKNPITGNGDFGVNNFAQFRFGYDETKVAPTINICIDSGVTITEDFEFPNSKEIKLTNNVQIAVSANKTLVNNAKIETNGYAFSLRVVDKDSKFVNNGSVVGTGDIAFNLNSAIDGEGTIETTGKYTANTQTAMEYLIKFDSASNVYCPFNSRIDKDFELKVGKTLTIPAGNNIWVFSGKLTNNGTIKYEGDLILKSSYDNMIYGNGKFETSGRYIVEDTAWEYFANLDYVKDLYIVSDVQIKNDFVLKDGYKWIFTTNKKITVSAGKTLTNNGTIDAGGYTITTTGTIANNQIINQRASVEKDTYKIVVRSIDDFNSAFSDGFKNIFVDLSISLKSNQTIGTGVNVEIKQGVTINTGAFTLTNDGAISGAGGINLNNASAKVVNNGTIDITGNITGTTGATFEMGASATVTCGNKIFYPSGTKVTAGTPISGKKYVYTVDCDTGVAGNQTGWKAQA